MKRAMQTFLYLLIGILGLAGCSNPSPVTAPPIAGEEPRQSLEEAVESGGTEAFMKKAFAHARASVPNTTLEKINAELRPHDKVFVPDGNGPFPTVLFFHGCSGATASHEEDWSAFYNRIGVAMIAVDSYAGRGINWVDACDAKVMTPWQRAADVLATVAHARTLDFVDSNALILTGFSHGAMTLWTTQVFASDNTAPISLEEWPAGGLDGVQLSFPFYGTCTGRWTIELPTVSFLGEDDRYIEEQSCIDYATNNQDMSDYFNYKVFAGATHTFDHARPNQSNVDAGSVYDPEATSEAQRIIAAAIRSLK